MRTTTKQIFWSTYANQTQRQAPVQKLWVGRRHYQRIRRRGEWGVSEHRGSMNQREMELEEFIESKKLSKNSAICRRLDALLRKEAHPLKEYFRQLKWKLRHLGHWTRKRGSMITQDFITNFFVLILFMAAGVIALGAASIVILFIQALRGQREYWG